MKNFIKNNIMGFIIGGILFGSIGAVSAYNMFANNIGYDNTYSQLKKSDNQDVENVQDAIDILYNKINNRLSFGIPEYYTSSGNADPSRSVNATLSIGKYIVIFYDGKGFNQSTYSPNPRPYEYNISSNKENCSITRISGYFMGVHSTSNININNVTNVFLVTVNEDNTIITGNQWSTSTSDTYPQYTVLTIIPINL